MKQKRHAGPLLGISRVAVHKWGETPPPARMWQLMQIRPEWFTVTE
jgi:hypothetical protein